MAEFRDLAGMGENILNSFNQGRERRREDDARMYYGQAAQGNTSALKSLFGVAPQQAMQLQTQQKAQSKADQEEISTLVWKGASAIKAAPSQVKPQVYAMVREQLAKHSGAQEWLSHLPPQYDPASAAAIDPVIEGIIARAGMYQPSTSADQAPAGLRQFEAMAANAGLTKGTPEYQRAAQIYLGQEARARNQVYESADGANVIKMGGGKDPTAAPVMMAPPEIVPSGGGQSVMGTGSQIVNDDGSMSPNPDFDSLNPVEKSKFASYVKNDVPFQIINGKVIAGQQLKPPPKAGAGGYTQLSPQEVASMGLPVGTVAQRGPNGQVSVISKPEAKKTKEISADVIKNAAQLPALARRIERLAQASEKITGMLDGGKLDQYLIGATNEATELESAAAQLRPMLLSFVRVPGIGSQSDLEARLDGMQYPDVSQPPATRKKNVDELRIFIRDLSNAYKNMASGGTHAPSMPSGGLTPAQQALLDKY